MDELLDTAPCGFLSFGDEGRISQVNATLAKMVNRGRETILGTHVERLLTVGGRIFYQTHVFPLMKLHGFADEIYLTLASEGRGEVPVLLNAIRSKRDGATVYDCAIFAIRQRGQFEDELLRAKKAAEEAAVARDDFLAVVSHELRTPLNAIVGWAHLMRMSSGDPAMIQQGLEVIERNAKAQTRLIEDLVDVSRVVSGKLRLDVATVNPADVVEATLDVVRPAADAKSIRIQTILDPNAGPVSGDPDRLQQVLWNLLSNAIKFTPKDGTVQVHLRRERSHVQLRVSDTGRGIDREFLPYVFDRFRQAKDASLNREGGLGLGMAITKEIVELHGGTIRAESEGAGRGATFVVSLPILPVIHPAACSSEPEGTIATEGSGLKLPSLESVRVLVVDDAVDARDLLTATLLRFGAAVTTVASAAEAFAAVQLSPPDVLVCDIEMPAESGISLMRRIRSMPDDRARSIPAVALTANSSFTDRIQALSAGFQVHVTKPVDSQELLVVIANLCFRNFQ